MYRSLTISATCGLLALSMGCPRPTAPTTQPIASTQPTTAPVCPVCHGEPRVVTRVEHDLDQSVAKIGQVSITARQLHDRLVQGYGVNMLLLSAQLEVVRQYGAAGKLTIGPKEIAAERQRTLDQVFRDATTTQERELLFQQLLVKQRLSNVEFDILIEINTYLRKLAEPKVGAMISEENIRQAFNNLYGETVVCRHIQVAAMADVDEVKRRLAAGEKFEDVARAMSRNVRTRDLGGELPEFSRDTKNLSPAFIETAFSLKTGEVSDAVLTMGEDYHIIKLEKRNPPKTAKFEDVRDSVRQTLYEQAVLAMVKAYREKSAQEVRALLQVADPELRKLYELKFKDEKREITDPAEIKRSLTTRRSES